MKPEREPPGEGEDVGFSDTLFGGCFESRTVARAAAPPAGEGTGGSGVRPHGGFRDTL
jgi:hypothetical protein